MHVCMLSHFSCAQLFATLWTIAHQTPLCPWNAPGKNTGVGCHALLEGIFQTQGSNLHLLRLLHWLAGSLPLAPPGNSGQGTRSYMPQLRPGAAKQTSINQSIFLKCMWTPGLNPKLSRHNSDANQQIFSTEPWCITPKDTDWPLDVGQDRHEQMLWKLSWHWNHRWTVPQKAGLTCSLNLPEAKYQHAS